MLPLAMLTVAACGPKNKGTDIIAHKPVTPKPTQTKKMGDYRQQRNIDWLGTTYTIDVAFEADATLPQVQDGPQKYYDNRIDLRILRKDGSVFFNKRFTKADFDEFLTKNYKENGALLGIVLDKAEGGSLVFAASVGSPDKSSDEYIPMILKVDRFGNVSISKDTQLDTMPDTETETYEDDGV